MTETTFLAFLLQYYPHFGWIGSLIILCGCLLAAIPYKGRLGEKYSLLNHFISELGEISVSHLAAVFNAGLILGGALYLPFIAGLGLTLNSWSGYIGMATGLIAAISSIFVGIYSMDRIEPHSKAAMTFFRFGLVTILFFTVAVFLQPSSERVIPLAVNIIGVIGIVSYAAFLWIVNQKKPKEAVEGDPLDTSEQKERPRFWRTPFWEWMLFFATTAWFLCVSLILLF